MATQPEQKIGPVTTSKIAAAMVAEVEASLPLLMHANKSVQKPFETAGDGDTMNVIVPEMPTVGDGAWINEGDAITPGGKGNELDYSNHAVPVTLKQKHVAFGIPSAMEFNSIEDMENLVTKPYGSTLASAIQTEVANNAMNAAAFTCILPSTGKFPAVAEAVSAIRQARAYGKLYGVIGSKMNGKLVGEGISYFNPQNNISDIWKSARLGEYSAAEWFTTPDIESFTLSTSGPGFYEHTIDSADIQTVSKGKRLFKGAGEYVWLRVDGMVNSAGTITPNVTKERYALKVTGNSASWVAGVKVADIFGNDTNEPYVFHVLDYKVEDVGGTKYLFLKFYNPGYGEVFYDGGDETLTKIHSVLPSSNGGNPITYHRGILYAENALCVAFGRFAKPVNASVGQYSGQNGVTIRTTSAYEVLKDRNVTRWDTLVGANLARPNWACEILLAE